MMPEIYGNAPLLRFIRTMAKHDRIPHACLLCGEKGTGRKTVARYLAMAALCTGADKPCGVCRSCGKILRNTHPDVIYAEHSGKKNGFSVETVRRVCRESIVAPNEGARKVYIFTDCGNMDVRSQNTLLKLTEEPPPHVLLIFTAESREAFLPTMLSRMMPLNVSPCSPEEARRALLQTGCAPDRADAAVKVCGGNIGRSLEWLHEEKMQEMTRNAAALTQAAARHSGYEILRILSLYEKDRAAALEFLKLLDCQIRDAAAMRFLPEIRTGCDRESAQALSQAVSVKRAVQLHEAVQEAYEALQASVSTKLALAALGGRLSQQAEYPQKG